MFDWVEGTFWPIESSYHYSSKAKSSHAGKEADVKAAYSTVVDTFGGQHPEVLIYNAGPGGTTWPPPSLLDISVDAFSKGFDSGVTGALIWLQQVCTILTLPVRIYFDTA